MTELPEEVLEVKRLVVTYHSTRAVTPVLRDINLTVRQGEFVSLVGESGSGKTTLSSAVLGLLPPTARIESGDILLSGRSIRSASEERLSRYRGRLVGLVPQDPGASLNPVRTIGRQIAEVFALRQLGYTREQARAETIRLLEEVEITDPQSRLGQYPHELSGGIKQRVLIAIAFALNPRLIVADEPTSALDVTVQRQVLDLFQKLAREHRTSVLLITHDISLATDYADRIVVLKAGEVVEDQPTQRVVEHQRSPYTKALLDAAFTTYARRTDADHQEPSADNDGSPAIRVEHLHKVYGRDSAQTIAVRDVTFEVRQGRTVGLVGESGSGKSTIGKILLKLVDETSGEVDVLGHAVRHLNRRERRAHWLDIQLVHQNPDSALDPRATVAEIVREPLDARGIGTKAERRQRVRDLVGQVLLGVEHLSKRPDELSGGQRQRVAIARALAVDAQILVLDEPVSALDVVTRSQVIDLLATLQRQRGLTYLFISHDLSVVRRLCDEVIVLRRGEIVEHGPTDRVFDEPGHEYTKTLVAAIPGHRYSERLAAVSGP